ncbi:hypothetical protein [Natronorubrum halophilum]|uniref:hypothetical protein n=1 Tax=Natronorubrum halophilum TaxID=1702106 RepID=UPI0013CED0F5|nr:hypothetical protein [Natronorubrum halophilum]
MSSASHPPESQPTSSSIEDAEETRWMLRKGVGLAVSSIVGLVLLSIGLSVLAGFISVPTAIGAFALGGSIVCIALVLMVLAIPSEDPDDEAAQQRPN